MTNTKTAAAPVTGSSAERVRPRRSHWSAKSLVQRWGLLLVLAATILYFSVSLPHTFPTRSNLHDILVSEAPSVLMALAAMLVLIVGEFDLSLGATFGFSQFVALNLMVTHHVSWPLAALIGLGIGFGIGLVNVALIVGANVSSFVATIGVQTVLLGVTTLVSNGNQPIFAGAPRGFTRLGSAEALGIPGTIYVAVAVALALWLVLGYTRFGRELRAAGANRVAAALSGLRVRRAVLCAILIAALLAAVAGLLDAAHTGTSDSTSGPSYLMPAYAAAFLGATAIMPGQFNVFGTLAAICLVAVGITGLQLQGTASWVTPVFNGGVLLVAVLLSHLAARSWRLPRLRRQPV